MSLCAPYSPRFQCVFTSWLIVVCFLGFAQHSAVPGDVTILEGIDVTKDDVGAKLSSALSGVKIDVVVHNAGGIGNRDGPDAPKGMAAFAGNGGGPMGPNPENLQTVTTERMLACFQVGRTRLIQG